MSALQTILIPKDKYKLRDAEKKIQEMGYKTSFYGKKADETENFYRFRQASPKNFIQGSYRTSSLKNGIQLVYGKLKVK